MLSSHPTSQKAKHGGPAAGGTGWLVLEVRDGTGGVMEAYTHGLDLSGTLEGAGGIGGILSVTHPSATNAAYFYHYDGNGNVVRLTDTNGAVVSTVDYTPFGSVLALSGPYTPRYQFSTKEYDAKADGSYYGYRYYMPRVGVWIARDPLTEIGFQQLIVFGAKRLAHSLSLEGYVFVRNAPVNWVDGFGLTVDNNMCCRIEIDPCSCACPFADKRFKARRMVVAGAVVCFRGHKCMCFWPENYPLRWNPNSPAAACLEAHEKSHYENSGDCPPSDSNDTPPPPLPAGQTSTENECAALKAQEECLDKVPESLRDETWHGMRQHVNMARSLNKCSK